MRLITNILLIILGILIKKFGMGTSGLIENYFATTVIILGILNLCYDLVTLKKKKSTDTQ